MFTVARQPLIDALDRCSRIANPRSTMPILSKVLLSFDGERLKYRATDLQLGIVGTLAADGDHAAFCVSPKDLADSLRTLAGDVVKLDQKGTSLTVTGDGKRRFRIAVINGDDFPASPKQPDKATPMPGGFRKALATVSHAMLSENLERKNLQGAHVVVAGQRLRVEATDGHRVARQEIECDSDEIEALIPRAAALALARTDGQVAIAATDTELFFLTGDETLVARQLNMVFPPIDNVIQYVDFKNRVRIDSAELSASLSAVGRIMAGKESRLLKFEVGDSLRIHGQGNEGEASDELACEATGKIEIGIDYAYMLDALKCFEGTIDVEFGSELDPVRVQKYGVTCVVMPGRI